MPGIVASRRLTASALCQATILASTSAILPSTSSSWPARTRTSSRARSGRSRRLLHARQEPRHVPRSLRLDDAELGEVPADRVDQLGALADEQVAHPVQHQRRLLRLALDRDEAHRRPCHRLADGRGVGGVVLAAPEVGLDVLRRHQPDLVPELPELARPEVGGRASLHADEAGLQPGEEGVHLGAPQPPFQDHAAGRIHAVDWSDPHQLDGRRGGDRA
jgi:hypothetical protein